MGRKTRVFLGALIILTLVGFSFFLLTRPRPEPMYNGKTLSAWLLDYKIEPADMNHFVEPGEWRMADSAVRAMGTNAYSFLLHMLQAHDGPWKLNFIALAQKQRLIKIHYWPAKEQRLLAKEAISRQASWSLDFVAGRPIPKLSQAEADQLVPTLIAMLNKNSDSGCRHNAADLLGSIGPCARSAVPHLLKAGESGSDPGIRGTCVRALGGIQSDPGNVVPFLADALADTNRFLVEAAVRALQSVPPDPNSADRVVPTLCHLLELNSNKGPHTMDIQYVPQALANYATYGKPAVPYLFRFIRAQSRANDYLIRPAASAIWKIDPEFAASHQAEIGPDSPMGWGFKKRDDKK